jgi:DNA-binding phage protein
MTRRRRTVLIGVSALAASAIAIGGGVAIAGGGTATDADLTALAKGIQAKDARAAEVADKLGTTSAKLQTAISEAAADRVDAVEKSGGLSATDADTLRSALQAQPRLAMQIAKGAEVAKKLGLTEEKLDKAFGDVARAQALARVDQAVKDGWITEKVAEQMRARIKAADLPGFGALVPGGHGFGGGHRGHGFGGPGLGGPAFGGLEPRPDGQGAGLEGAAFAGSGISPL